MVLHLHHHDVLLIEAAPAEWANMPPTLIAEFAAPYPKNIEHAGKAYHDRVSTLAREEEDIHAVEDALEHKLDDGEPVENFVSNVESIQHVPHDDYYGLLGIPNMVRSATVEQIRKAYRQVSLYYHPDKNALQDIQKSEEIFKAIQTAYDTLVDPKKRQVYDSVASFDDSIPNPPQNEEFNFYEVYGPVFERNSVFSTIQPVPQLGDDDTPYLDVTKFYAFWVDFKSWREFPNEEQFDLDEAECREERRWMERQNQKIQAAAKRDELARVRLLAETARKRDPRILRRKAQREAEKMERKRAEEEAKRLKLEEEKRAEEEAKRIEEAKLAEVAAQKDGVKRAKENVKRLQKKIRRKLNALKADYPQIDEDTTKTYIAAIPAEDLESIAVRMESGEMDSHSILSHFCSLTGLQFIQLAPQGQETKEEEEDSEKNKC